MKRSLFVLLFLLFLLSCYSKDPQSENALYDRRGLPLAEKDVSLYKLNPEPKQAYEVKVQIQDAPGSLKLKRFWIQYNADNCLYTTNRWAGATASPIKILDIDYQKIDEHTYKGVAYLDGMLDEDYYAQGVCRWHLTVVQAFFSATGSEKETRFYIDINKKDLIEKQSIKKYYRKKFYPYLIREDGTTSDGLGDSGQKEPRTRLIPENQWFSMTMTAKEK